MVKFTAPAPRYVGPAKFHGGDHNDPIDYLVLHGTVSPCRVGGARAVAAFFTKQITEPASAHYVTDPRESVQVVHDSVVAYHDGVNTHSLGIEMCDLVGTPQGKPLPLRRWRGPEHTAMLHVTARLVADLCIAYDIPAVMLGPRALKAGKRGICDHHDVSRAFHRSDHWDLGLFPRQRFIRLVRAEIAARQAGGGAPTRHRVAGARDVAECVVRRPRIVAARRKRAKAGVDALPIR